MIDLAEWAISDAGPNCPVAVYVRTSGKIIWTSRVPLFFRGIAYYKAMRHAKRMVEENNNRHGGGK